MIIGTNAPEISVHPEVLVAMAIVTDYSIETCRGTELVSWVTHTRTVEPNSLVATGTELETEFFQ